MSHSTPPDCEPNSPSTLPEQPGVVVVRTHHFLVSWSHLLKVPILLGLISEWHLDLLGFAGDIGQNFSLRRHGAGRITDNVHEQHMRNFNGWTIGGRICLG